jgi:hypothetical protein
MNIYKIGCTISFVIVFLGCWIYCIASYGFLLGVGIGWFPSLIAAGILSFFWPLLVLGLIVLSAAIAK